MINVSSLALGILFPLSFLPARNACWWIISWKYGGKSSIFLSNQPCRTHHIHERRARLRMRKREKFPGKSPPDLCLIWLRIEKVSHPAPRLVVRISGSPWVYWWAEPLAAQDSFATRDGNTCLNEGTCIKGAPELFRDLSKRDFFYNFEGF